MAAGGPTGEGVAVAAACFTGLNSATKVCNVVEPNPIGGPDVDIVWKSVMPSKLTSQWMLFNGPSLLRFGAFALLLLTKFRSKWELFLRVYITTMVLLKLEIVNPLLKA